MISPESPLLQQMNRLKDAASEAMLTDAQQEAFSEIKQHREDEARFINLHGPRYAGKTFLCWILSQSSDWYYNQAIADNPDTPTVVYDHGDPERRTTRQLRNHASIHGLATTVYVTRRPADELYPRVELKPGDEHYEQVAKNWEELGLNTDTAPAPIQR
jgi:hypothetical protein